MIQAANSMAVAAVLELVQQIPPELIVLDANQYAQYCASIAALHDAVATWRQGNRGIRRIPGLPQHNPITLIRLALEACPDEFPAHSTSELKFITDTNLRENLRQDVSAVNMALTNGEWKAATVLAGSVTEALLLWALQRNASQVPATVSKLGMKIDPDLEKWSLHSYIEVAAELGMIKSDTATQCRLAKDFRNLIHPGRALRLGQVCNRGTALSAVAAVEHVIQDLTP